MNTAVIKYKLYDSLSWNFTLQYMREQYADLKCDSNKVADLILDKLLNRYYIEDINFERTWDTVTITVSYESSHTVKIKRFRELVHYSIIISEL